ncbi:MAG TPA: hypothetical protein VL334_13930, partial [Anaerolineae bacterium]|nr:hypothetical protein [Anaerolineae bacterium]
IVKEARLAQKAEALARLAAMDLPVEDWEIMEVEIMEGRYRVIHEVVRWSPEAFVQEMSQRRKTPTTPTLNNPA